MTIAEEFIGVIQIPSGEYNGIRRRDYGRIRSRSGNAGIERRGGTAAIERAAGAGEGNRTLVVSLGSFCSTIELHPRDQALTSERVLDFALFLH